mmetsp:Transcript_12029/g.21732  ORF Transcript_12029/g.21732 Transcript_12029/m.21732 type:complete len:634 (+) Transcript_12029:83-1984(+)
MATLKLQCDDGEIYRLTLQGALSFESVIQAVATSRHDIEPEMLSASGGCSLKYADDEGDLCTLAPATFNDFVEQQGGSTAKVLKLKLQLPKKLPPKKTDDLPKPETSPSASAEAQPGATERPRHGPPPGLGKEEDDASECSSSRAGLWGPCGGGGGPRRLVMALRALRDAGVLTPAMFASLAVQWLPLVTQRVTRKVDKINHMARDGLSQSLQKLLQEVKDAARPAAQKDDLELRDFARSGAEVDGQKLPALEDLQKWDHFFYSQRLLLARYAVDREALRVYFPFPAAIKGLQGLTHRLFGVTLEPVHGEVAAAAKWHADVELFQVARGKELMGYVMVDPFSRPGEKRAGGWMQQLVSREQRPSKQPRLPVAAVMTNFPQPQEGKPSLLSLEEVSTLFHEFGHAMQHVLTVQNESSVSGINGIEWDAVEVASQFMEYWVDYDRQTLFSMARHYETGEPLPEESYKKLLVAKNFRSGTGLLGQVYLATMDLRLHEGYKEGEDPDGIAKAVGREVLINPPLPEGRPLCSFSHIFDGGYAAGYYSYLWSQVLSADAFNAFDTAGNLTVTQALVNFGAQDSKGEDAVEKLGRRWASTVLADGGGRAPEKVFIDFLGRQPSAAALLHYSGLDLPGALV